MNKIDEMTKARQFRKISKNVVIVNIQYNYKTQKYIITCTKKNIVNEKIMINGELVILMKRLKCNNINDLIGRKINENLLVKNEINDCVGCKKIMTNSDKNCYNYMCNKHYHFDILNLGWCNECNEMKVRV